MEPLALRILKKCSMLSISRSIVSHNLKNLYCDDAELSKELGNLSQEDVSALMPILTEMIV